MNKLLRAKRVITGIKQNEIAKYLGIGVNSYSFKETGKKNFTQIEIKKLIDFFDLTPEETISIFFS